MGQNGNSWDMAGTVDDISGMSELQASTARSGHRVRLADGKRHDVPNFVLIDPKTNKLGYAVVWLIPATFDIHCFLPGAGGEDKAARRPKVSSTLLGTWVSATSLGFPECPLSPCLDKPLPI